MKLSEFDFRLPEELIALHPAEERDECKMMVLHRKSGDIEHFQFKDLINFVSEDDVLVLNDTKVFPVRLYGSKERTGAMIEVFLLRELNRQMHYWDVLVEPARKIRIGNKLYFNEDEIIAEVIDNTTSRGRTLRFLYDGDYDEFRASLARLGNPPLPSYIISRREVEPEDYDNYQTIFAKNEGAVAAPASGMHFSRQLLKRMEIKGVDMQFLTCHVGLGTFKSIDVEDLTKHKMDSEQIIIGQELVDHVENAHQNGKHVIAVGTDVMRAMESVVGTDGHMKSYDGWTNKFIFPPHDYTVADQFVCNFYMPRSSQLMLTAAFAGYKNMMHAYDEAVKNGYTFGDYGDAMLIID